MTHEHTASRASGGSAGLPAAVSVILTLIWAAYTLLILYEIFSLPVPAL
ncbi:MAG: hypothetical protein AB7Q23_15520 [Hyphomonadaceae bacterium]